MDGVIRWITGCMDEWLDGRMAGWTIDGYLVWWMDRLMDG